MFAQDAAALSRAQEELRNLAVAYVSGFEARVRYEQEADPQRATWRPKPVGVENPDSVMRRVRGTRG